jgi:cytidylate kinase
VARTLASRLGVPYIDTGAMYRAVGVVAREQGIRLRSPDAGAVERLASRSRSRSKHPGEVRVSRQRPR